MTVPTSTTTSTSTGARPRLRFSIVPFAWKPWLETVADLGPTPEQEAVLDEVVPRMRTNPYYQLLAHGPEPLRQRTGLFDGIMKSEGGSPLSDRELAAVATSRVNGCVFCAAVHARAYDQMTHDTDQIQRLLDEGVDTRLEPRERAIVDVAVRLTRDPASFSAADLAPLRALGLSDLEIVDVTNGAAIFAWANRLLQTLGESQVAEPAAAA